MIEIKVIGQLTKYTNESNKLSIESKNITSIEDVKTAAGMPVAVQTIVMVNGKRPAKGQEIRDGDAIVLISPVSGG